ncbi:MAG: 1-acyl-sn-glycerol-3-phosphate acyltransferase [Candidatus Endonucleobacter bathymodioli]|uniref:1-acyl-sn-glycerol-3-phosphate acyltransferase n=1 Tax=Candidatus Endonucleibacter bathymodioli TaxID=539814 RepID=A0AA90NJL0_9GAMM|nr:1-acyl-sn-glycerol-3-phosphate acyltransferase [Candidatus Endonucleobacter bathymodioli]
MQQFDEIRPYHDDEVRPTLNRLLADRCFLNVLARHRYPVLTEKYGRLLEWLVGIFFRSKVRNINSIHELQSAVKPYVSNIIEKTTDRVSFSGIENLKSDGANLFLSNHRDIVLDPAFVHYGMYLHRLETPRIAIGDNLLSRPFASDLMRLNKSFIVRRSVSDRREKLKVYQTLSAYIQHSIDTGHSIWLAQREGRAKDGNDLTDTALIKMLYMSKKGLGMTFADNINSLHIVPVAISYEYDPCDERKAIELQGIAEVGQYQKAADEDMKSMAIGIEGFKGHVHVSFGSQLDGLYPRASDVSEAVDRQIHANYKLHPSNYIAWEKVRQSYPDIQVPDIYQAFPEHDIKVKRQEFLKRMEGVSENLHPWIYDMYARPVINHFKKTGLV